MSIFDNELILPGTITEIESDYSFGYDTSLFGSTDAVTIIGTAFNGPVGKPIPIYSPEHAKYLFGNIYDYKTKQEATLVAEILDAWDRGCKTIYAVRLSGKQIEKDFQLSTTNDFKLRVSGIFPSNENKDISLVYDDNYGESKISIYKPSKKATIQEKMQGDVDLDDSILKINLDINNSYGLSKESRLQELIKIVNEHPFNNVLRLSIIDRKGNDVTYTSKEAKSISVGSLFAGAYFIGRNKNLVPVTTNLQYKIATKTSLPHEGFEGNVFKELIFNSDINKDLPIYAEKVEDLNEFYILNDVNMSIMFDILSNIGMIDKIYGKNDIDYEEVNISEFEAYSRLGSGYATTAKAVLRGKPVEGKTQDIKVIETPVTNDKRIAPLKDGVYSVLENLTSKYRVMTIGNADSDIKDKIPKKNEFKISKNLSGSIFEKTIDVTPIINKKDLTKAKKYDFTLSHIDIDENPIEDISETNLFSEQTIDHIAYSNIDESHIDTIAAQLENSDLFINTDTVSTKSKLYYVKDKKAIESNSKKIIGKMFYANETLYIGEEISTGVIELREVLSTDFTQVTVSTSDKAYIIVNSNDNLSIHSIIEDTVLSAQKIVTTSIGSVEDVFNSEEDMTLISIEDIRNVELVNNKISIKSNILDYTSLEEFVEILNTHPTLSLLFKFNLAKSSIIKKDEYIVSDATDGSTEVFGIKTHLPVTGSITNKEIIYDTEMYIPYKTSDNFARQLAQHCTYTSLKTAPTHGIIGCSRVVNNDLGSIASKVDEVTSKDLNLYAKKPNGKDMLDKNNLPYPIGRNVSVVLGQYILSTGDGYNYVSNGASGYSGMVSSLPLNQSSTNQPINIPFPMYEFSNHQLANLTKKGFVTFKNSYTKGIVVTDGITMAPATSSMRRLSVTRIIGSVEEIIRAAAEPFIGKQNHLANRNSMQTAIKSSLDKIKGTLIEDYVFNLVHDPGQARLGIIDIDYSVVPVYEIVQVKNRLSVKETLT